MLVRERFPMAKSVRAQGATQQRSVSAYCPLVGQGATEYLVLLAVVLIVALVSVALLGFFPGMASDAQITQSQMYWRSAQTISIIESGARVYSTEGVTYSYLRVRNSGAYPLRLTAIIGADGQKATTFYGTGTCGAPNAYVNIQDYFYLGPGEEKYFAWSPAYGTACSWQIFSTTGPSTGAWIGGASSNCQNSSISPGTLAYKTLGFEYIEYLDNNQQITKRQMGKELIVKCGQPY